MTLIKKWGFDGTLQLMNSGFLCLATDIINQYLGPLRDVLRLHILEPSSQKNLLVWLICTTPASLTLQTLPCNRLALKSSIEYLMVILDRQKQYAENNASFVVAADVCSDDDFLDDLFLLSSSICATSVSPSRPKCSQRQSPSRQMLQRLSSSTRWRW